MKVCSCVLWTYDGSFMCSPGGAILETRWGRFAEKGWGTCFRGYALHQTGWVAKGKPKTEAGYPLVSGFELIREIGKPIRGR